MAQVTLVSAAGRSLLFVCPANGRVRLARVCYRQFALMLETLRGWGLDAQLVVVADDDNLDAAEENGFVTIEHENRLGAKLNAGYQWAAEHGFDYVCAVGNDSWMHPDRFRWLPAPDALLCTRNYTVVSPDGAEQAWLKLSYDGGTGSRVIPTRWLAGCGYRPVHDSQTSGCDTATLLAICRNVERAPHLVYTDLHPYEVVGFQSPDEQITKWGAWTRHFLHEMQKPFHGLAAHYPGDLVAAVRDHYAAVPA